MIKKIFFRTDASATIGRGHLSRCLAVAEMLKTQFEIEFIFDQKNIEFINKVDFRFTKHFIESEEGIFNLLDTKDLVWLDGYHFSESFKSQLKAKVSCLIETNDMPYEARNVDIIFNHTPGISKEQFGNTTAKLYLGLDYAMLRPSFLEYAETETKSEVGNGVFICFGGADTFNLGEKFVNKLIENNFDAPIYWVSNHTSKCNFSSAKNCQILYNLSENEMIDYMTKSKVLLIPSSVLSIEAIALRKPFFTGYFVDNQKLIFDGLDKLGLAECFGHLKNKTDLENAIFSFLRLYGDLDKLQKQRERHREYLTGNSASRLKHSLSMFLKQVYF